LLDSTLPGKLAECQFSEPSEREQKHFISKLSDSDAENTETQVWLDFSLSCKYIENKKYNELRLESEEVGKLLNFMMNNPDKFR